VGHTNVYAVYGPSSEWADGQGLYGYAATPADAEAWLQDMRAEEAEYGPASWRTVDEVGAIVAVPLAEIFDADPALRDIFEAEGLDALVDALNYSVH
jgi:hypothetical protein